MTDFTPEYARHESIQSRLFIVQAAAEVRNKLKAGEPLFTKTGQLVLLSFEIGKLIGA
jgi:hypothetical protein